MKAKELIEAGIDDPEQLVPHMLGQMQRKRDVVKALAAPLAISVSRAIQSFRTVYAAEVR